ncbi:MAG: P-type conjugative transfer protein TrbG, partial [Bdellovibrionales bacterium]|nr:P-type conjugative transfer protein TrbG [Bdellovibrionales bacterium]
KTPNLEEELSSLVDQVDRLKSTVVLTKQNALATRTPRSNKSLGAITKYVYDDSKIYEVHTAVNRATEILLQPGEELTMAPVAGDTELWIFAVMHSGSGREARAHILVRPRVEGVETNVILATNRRTYRLQAIETGTYMPAIQWSYPQDEMARLQATYKRKKEEVRGVDPTKLRYGYKIDGDDVRWRPLQAFDDGKKTYIQLPGVVQHREAPAIFILNEDDEPMLVTSRPKGDFLVVDRLFDRAELRIGERAVEIIAPDYERESFFERLF